MVVRTTLASPPDDAKLLLRLFNESVMWPSKTYPFPPPLPSPFYPLLQENMEVRTMILPATFSDDAKLLLRLFNESVM